MSTIYWSWRNISGSLRRIWQNIIWGWNESDVWSLDRTIAKFVLPRLKYYRKIVHGYPCSLSELSDENNINSKDQVLEKQDDDLAYDKRFKEWKKILDKIIQTFEWIIIDCNDISDECSKKKPCFYLPFKFVPCKDNPEYSTMEYDATPEQIAKHDIIFKEYSDKCIQREKDIQEGLQLFAKYFRGLWD